MERRLIEVHGVVQGVGFRPFIKFLADRLGIKGHVQNLGAFVRIEAQGDDLDKFIAAIKTEAPPLARIQEINVTGLDRRAGEDSFVIQTSSEAARGVLQMPADAGICQDCLAELLDQNDRRYLHPFIACTNCGPRYSMIAGAPYDRERTTMVDFPLCARCQAEYDEPGNRRYHAQPVCCKECGPRLYILDTSGNKNYDDPIAKARKTIRDGGIVAAKGLGGYHLICNARDKNAVILLRERKRREAKPFAVMAPDLDTAAKWCCLNEPEGELLISAERPIVLLRKHNDIELPYEIAFNNPFLGMMLPSTGMQRLLFDYPDGHAKFELLIMTSGNLSEEPICIMEHEAIEKLGGIADCILAHDRMIITREDDSVTRVFNGEVQMIRRARGFAPLPIQVPFDTGTAGDIFAAGGQTKNTWCLMHQNLAFTGPHIGDLDDVDALLSYSASIERFCTQTGILADTAASDLHPEYLSTRYAHRFHHVIPVQHHHAHMTAAMAENGLTGDVIGVIFDGLGLGDDGSVWGGEFLTGGYAQAERTGHITPVTMAGGDRAAKETWLAASFWLRASSEYGQAAAELAKRMEGENKALIDSLLSSRTLQYETTSAGRLFDAVSAMLGICLFNRYEGEAAMALEWLAEGTNNCEPYVIIINNGNRGFIIDLRKALAQIAGDILDGCSDRYISGRFHETMAEAVRIGAVLSRERKKINQVVLSGGVFQNTILLKRSIMKLEKDGFEVHIPGIIPGNDGGLSLGQAAVAAARMNKSQTARGVA